MKIEQFEERLLFASFQFASGWNLGGIERAEVFASDDFDGDSDLDIVISPREWFENQFIQERQAFERHISGGERINSRLAVATGDIDSDGDQEFIMSAGGVLAAFGGPKGSIDVFEYSRNDERFILKQSFSRELGGARHIAIGDIDGDGDLDLVSSMSDYADRWLGYIAWHENENGIFKTIRQLPLTRRTKVDGPIVIADLDGDGDGDVVTQGTKVWYEYDGETGEFMRRELLVNEGTLIGWIDVGDLDGDGDNDILTAQRTEGRRELVWYENDNSDGDFENQRVIDSSIGGVRQLVIADIDNDGDLDPVARTTNSIHWYENSSGVFLDQQEVLTSEDHIKHFDLLDIDSDGDKDIVAVVGETDEPPNKLVFYENRSIAVTGDVNNDGRFDSSDLVAIFQAGEYEDKIDGNSTFKEGDFDGDGDFTTTDLVFAFTKGSFVAESNRHDIVINEYRPNRLKWNGRLIDSIIAHDADDPLCRLGHDQAV